MEQLLFEQMLASIIDSINKIEEECFKKFKDEFNSIYRWKKQNTNVYAISQDEIEHLLSVR